MRMAPINLRILSIQGPGRGRATRIPANVPTIIAITPVPSEKVSRRLSKIQKLFDSLQDEEQRVVLKQIESLSQRSKKKK